MFVSPHEGFKKKLPLQTVARGAEMHHVFAGNSAGAPFAHGALAAHHRLEIPANMAVGFGISGDFCPNLGHIGVWDSVFIGIRGQGEEDEGVAAVFVEFSHEIVYGCAETGGAVSSLGVVGAHGNDYEVGFEVPAEVKDFLIVELVAEGGSVDALVMEL